MRARGSIEFSRPGSSGRSATHCNVNDPWNRLKIEDRAYFLQERFGREVKLNVQFLSTTVKTPPGRGHPPVATFLIDIGGDVLTQVPDGQLIHLKDLLNMFRTIARLFDRNIRAPVGSPRWKQDPFSQSKNYGNIEIHRLGPNVIALCILFYAQRCQALRAAISRRKWSIRSPSPVSALMPTFPLLAVVAPPH